MDNLSIIYGDLGRLDECIEILVKKMKVDPKDPEIYFNLGVTYCEKNDYHSSMRYYLKAVKLRPDYPSAYINMASMTMEEGDNEKGLDYLLKALELPIDDNFILGILYEDLITVYTKLENTEKAAYYKIKLDDLRSTTKENNKID